MQGATIKTDEETGKIIIARIMHGGAADRSGLIHVGDEVIEVNGINVEGKTPNDVLTILVSKYRINMFSADISASEIVLFSLWIHPISAENQYTWLNWVHIVLHGNDWVLHAISNFIEKNPIFV